MSDRYTPYLESSFPTLDPPQELTYRLASVARTVAASRRRRRNWGLFGILVCMGLGWRLENPWRASRMILRATELEQRQPMRTEALHGGRVYQVDWQSGKKRLTKSFRTGITTLTLPDAVYEYHPELGMTVRKQPNEPIIRHLSPVVGWCYTLFYALFDSFQIEQAVEGGRAVDRIMTPGGPEDRVAYDLDPTTHRMLGMSFQRLTQTGWVEVDHMRMTPEANLAADFFSPAKLGPGPVLNLEDLRTTTTERLLTKRIGNAELGRGRSLVCRSVEMLTDGTLYVAYSGPQDEFGRVPFTAKDNNGNSYFLTRTLQRMGNPMVHGPQEPQDVYFAELAPTRTFRAQFPLTVTLQVRSNGHGGFAIPTYTSGEVYDIRGQIEWPKEAQLVEWGTAQIAAPSKYLLPTFAALCMDGPIGGRAEVLFLRESRAFETQDWDALLEAENGMLATGQQSRWVTYNNFVAACLGKGDATGAQKFRALRNACADRPPERDSVWSRTFSHSSSIPPTL